MIIQEITNSNSIVGIYNFNSIALLNTNAVPTTPVVIAQGEGFDYCAFECNYIETVFADTVDDSFYKNDNSAFLFSKSIAADTILFELHKGSVKVADLDTNDYGTYYESFTAEALYTGFVIDWRLVYSAFGGGLYQFKAVKNILGTDSTFNSRLFRLLPFSDDMAHDTVKIETYQQGNILGSELDYTDLLNNGWYNSYRIEGNFGFKTQSLEIDNYVNQDYEKLQVKDSVNTEYTLETRLLPSLITNVLAYDSVLADLIQITDYNLFNTESFRRVQLYPINFEEVKHFSGNRNMKYTIKFAAKKDNFIKRRF